MVGFFVFVIKLNLQKKPVGLSVHFFVKFLVTGCTYILVA